MVLQISKKKLKLLKAIIFACVACWFVSLFVLCLQFRLGLGLLWLALALFTLWLSSSLWEKMCRCPQCGEFLQRTDVSKLHQMGKPDDLPEFCPKCGCEIRVEHVD